ncbi:MAG: hypothetical protein H0U95_12235 [Bacteroidetes bacterium]|nr:hypothetical protein [Bacteroidota bacterium]
MSKLNALSQKKNNFIFDVGFIGLIPKGESFKLDRDSNFPDDYSYHLKFYPRFGFGAKAALGYEINLLARNSYRLKFPILLSYRLVKERNKQVGEYYGGFSNIYFSGNREVNSIIHVASLSMGVNYTRQDYNKNEWAVDLFITAHVNPLTKFHVKENSINCNYCSINDTKYFIKDNALYYSIDFKVARLFKVSKILIGPFLSYNINTFYTRVYKITLLDYKFNNPAFNLTYYYHFLETGLKIKI